MTLLDSFYQEVAIVQIYVYSFLKEISGHLNYCWVSFGTPTIISDIYCLQCGKLYSFLTFYSELSSIPIFYIYLYTIPPYSLVMRSCARNMCGFLCFVLFLVEWLLFFFPKRHYNMLRTGWGMDWPYLIKVFKRCWESDFSDLQCFASQPSMYARSTSVNSTNHSLKSSEKNNPEIFKQQKLNLPPCRCHAVMCRLTLLSFPAFQKRLGRVCAPPELAHLASHSCKRATMVASVWCVGFFLCHWSLNNTGKKVYYIVSCYLF